MKEDHHTMFMRFSVVAIVIIVLIVVLLPLIIQNMAGQATSRCKECQAPVAGQAYSASQDLPPGSYCSSSSQCSSNLCLNNQCRASNLGTNQRCTWTEQCQSGLYCPQTVPVGTNRVCLQKLLVGDSCGSDDACTSGRCDPVDDACEVYQCVPENDDASVPVCDVPY